MFKGFFFLKKKKKKIEEAVFKIYSKLLRTIAKNFNFVFIIHSNYLKSHLSRTWIGIKLFDDHHVLKESKKACQMNQNLKLLFEN